MKKSTMVTLVLSGALMGGCDNRVRTVYQPNDPGPAAEAEPTNNTYVPGMGYYHAPYHGWYKYPYNYFQPDYGYYHGGVFSPDPAPIVVVSSRPPPPSTFRTGGGVVGGGGSHIGSIGTGSSVGGSSHVGSSGIASSVSRGGFGSIGHGGSVSS